MSTAESDAVAGRWLPFTKGHGTQNDFVVIEDLDDAFDLRPDQVARLCDRRAGIGADGVLRVVRGGQIGDWSGDPDVWFMDYRNADGSVAEMCGNGIRVFVRYLADRGLLGPEGAESIPVGTRDGLVTADLLPDGRIRASIRAARVLGADVTVTASGGEPLAAYRVNVGNPHAVAFLTEALATVDLHRPPRWSPAAAFPDGVNIEFVREVSDRRIELRVFERGSGETRSCGTGTCAAAAAAAARSGLETRPVSYRVDVPGGSVEVELTDDRSYLTGPAVLVGHGMYWLDE